MGALCFFEFVQDAAVYDLYRGDEKVSALLTQLSWSHNLIILG